MGDDNIVIMSNIRGHDALFFEEVELWFRSLQDMILNVIYAEGTLLCKEQVKNE